MILFICCFYLSALSVRIFLTAGMLAQYMSPSAGWAKFLLAFISARTPASIFSMVVSRFQFLKRGNFEGSSVPFYWLTEGMLILELNLQVMGTSGYWGPQVIDMK